MSAEIVSLSGKATLAEPDPCVIAKLEAALDDARAGRIDGLAMTLISSDGYIKTNWAGKATVTELLGAVSRMEFAMNMALEERS